MDSDTRRKSTTDNKMNEYYCHQNYTLTHYETFYYNKMHFGFGIIAKVAVIIIEIQIFSTIETIFNN
ncbi:hypothetical protein DERP_000297 [Dermatophagoides pteronyssinus]|uniref:Uncharacterized protein n=1 Tax=Dermatophagoides pteronyssinus TaxID=6956 RepID=A0ABQ8IZR7_DERPT|nr:hypothetical protein DERP_000297 [Dermatophagoides pteronyssinus]